MKSMQEINKDIEDIKEKRKTVYKQETQIQNKINKLEEQKDKIYDKFEKDIKKLFGILEVEIYHGKFELKIVFDDKTLFQYNSEELNYKLIGLKNGMKLKEMYEDVYGEPEETYGLEKASNLFTSMPMPRLGGY